MQSPEECIRDFREEVDQLTKVSAALSACQLERCKVIAHGMAEYLRGQAAETIRAQSRCGKPVLMVYQCDGWSCRVRKDAIAVEGSHLLKRKTHFRHEFLIERGIIRTRSAGLQDEPDTVHMIFGPPRGLRLGKTSWNIYTASCDFLDLLCAHHSGLCITLYVQDGMLFDASLRLFKARHSLYHSLFPSEADTLHSDKDIVLGMRCKSHSIHNSVQWGLPAFCSAKQVLDDCFVVLKSLLSCSSALHDKIDAFLLGHVSFVTKDGQNNELVDAWWKLLDVNDSIRPQFVRLDPWFTNGRLEVNRAVENDPDVMSTLHRLMMYSFRWLVWSLTRRCRAGRCARRYLRSKSMGLDAVVGLVFADPNWSNYKLTGVGKCKGDILFLLGVASLSTIGPESALLQLLKDDRFLKRADKLWVDLEDHIRAVGQIDMFVWGRLGAVVGMSPGNIRHEVLLASCASAGYMYRDAWCDVRKEPFSLTQKDIAHNVRLLAEREIADIRDPTVRQLKRLLSVEEVNEEQLQDLLLLLRDSPCSGNLCEEGHASGAILHRYHSDYSKDTLRSRSLLHQMRALCRLTPTERKLERLNAQEQRLGKKMPGQRIHSRQVLLKRYWEETEADATAETPLAKSQRSEACVKQLADKMNGMSRAELHELRRGVPALRREKADEIAARRAKITEKKNVLKQAEQERLRGCAEDNVVNHVRTARLPDHKLAELASLLHSRRAKISVPLPSAPAPPDDVHMKQLEDEILKQPVVERPAMPWWMGRAIAHRERFRGVGFTTSTQSDSVVWLMLFAMQNPQNCTFLRLSPLPRVLGDVDDFDDGTAFEYREFDFSPLQFAEEHELGLDEDAELLCLFDIKFRGTIATCSGDFESFDWVAMKLPTSSVPAPAAGPRAAKAPRRPLQASEVDELLRKCPFLSSDDLRQPQRRANNRRAAETCGPAHEGEVIVAGEGPESEAEEGPASEAENDFFEPGVDDGEIADGAVAELAMDDGDDVWHELGGERGAWAWEKQDEMDFYTRILGGKWLMEHKGKVSDQVCGYARKWTHAWCSKFKWPRQRGFAFGKFGREAAHMLCREWCCRAQHFWNLWVASDDADFKYTQEDVDNYPEHLEFIDFLLSLPVESETLAAGTQIQAMRPRLGLGCLVFRHSVCRVTRNVFACVGHEPKNDRVRSRKFNFQNHYNYWSHSLSSYSV